MSVVDLSQMLRSSSGRPGRALQWLSDLLLLWADRVRQRQDLRRLDDHLLRDLGVSRSQVEAEANKPFWRA